MSRIGDPGLRYMTAMVEVWGRMALRLANAEVLPYDLGHYAATVEGFLEKLAEVPGLAENLDLGPARAAVGAWAGEAAHLETALGKALVAGAGNERFAALNEALLGAERQLLLEEGIPDRPWFKHVLYAPRYTYAAMSLPGVREAAEKGDWELAKEQLERLTARLEAVAAQVRQAADRAAAAGETRGDES